jgi:NAD(P)H-hydrate epimerase
MTGPHFGQDALLTVAEMYAADAAAMSSGVASLSLMEAAGAAVADAVRSLGGLRPVCVLCGPGNNGGDGFVAARLLRDDGWPVRLGLLGDAGGLTGDARHMAELWTGEVEPLTPAVMEGAETIVDALFGAGLTRAVDGPARAAIEAIGGRECVAVDVPSGVHGDSGEILGVAPVARVTVTFFRRKPGHLLLPGRSRCGAVRVADIGIPETVLDAIAPRQGANDPRLWLDEFPWARLEQHKYDRGHALISGGPQMTGAARLAAQAARRIGTGMVSVAVPNDNAVVYKVALVGAIVRPVRNTAAYAELAEEPRVSACLLGPGNGVVGSTREHVLAALRTEKPVVLDADALTVFADSPDLLFSSIRGPCLLTPHDGEFSRLFALDGDKPSRARAAAERSGAVILLKGADTVIAAPDGRVVINENAPPELASGGTGDVLAGFSVGLMAQGMDPFTAACAATWLHGAAAQLVGPGLIAEDLPENLPKVLQRLRSKPDK